MKRSRYNCINCGTGFLAIATDERFCKRKCKKEYFEKTGQKWTSHSFRPRTKKMSTEEKLKYIESLKF